MNLMDRSSWRPKKVVPRPNSIGVSFTVDESGSKRFRTSPNRQICFNGEHFCLQMLKGKTLSEQREAKLAKEQRILAKEQRIKDEENDYWA